MKKLYLSIVSLFLIIGTTIAVSFAWFINTEFKAPAVSGYSSSAYYAVGSGDGKSEANAFLITQPRHMYNFAWLQYLNTYNSTVVSEPTSDANGTLQQYYFRIPDTVKEIDMTGWTLPPIGTEETPFIGNFNGNNCVIKGLTTTNAITESTNIKKPNNLTKYAFGNIVGMFGLIGYKDSNVVTINEKNYEYSSTIASVSHMILDDMTVESNASTTLIGLLAGYVNASVSYVGIHYSSMKLASGVGEISEFDNLSKYTLIGDYNDKSGGIDWTGKPGSAGIGFGGSLDILSMYNRMKYISTNSWDYPSLNVPSNIDEGSHPKGGSAMPLIVSNMVDSDYYSSNAQEITASNNIGYYTGNDAKIYSKNTKNNLDSADYTLSPDGKITDIKIYTSKSNISGAQDPTVEVESEIKSDILSLVNEERLYGIRLNSQISQNNPVTINGAIIAGQDYTTATIPQDAVWFVPQMNGTVKIVLATLNNGTQGFSLYRINRTSDSSEANPYNRALSSPEIIDTVVDGSNTLYDQTWVRELATKKIYYFEIPVEANQEYALGQSNSNGSYLIYLDVGQNAGAEPEYSGTISNIDFVYVRTDGQNTVYQNITAEDYDSSDVVFSITGTTTSEVILYFKRKETLGVLYFVSGTGVTVTSSGSGANSLAKNENCDESNSTT